MILEIVEAQPHDIGGGFTVGRVLPRAGRRHVGPFVFFDHMGPKRFAAGFDRSLDVRPHPHIGLSTLTYLFDGEITHRDSVGSNAAIRPGEVNWMTAGRGVTHSERFETLRRDGGTLHGLQAWIALPEADEEIEPSFSHHGPEDLPTYEGEGLWARLAAGEAFGARAAVKTHSPLFYVHWRLAPGARAQLSADYPERAAFMVRGEAQVEGVTLRAGQMALLGPGSPVFTAVGEAEIMLLGGEPLGPRYLSWNFVSSSAERIEQAKADWRAGRMKLPDLDHDEFIPLPPDPPGARLKAG
ncbi:MAG: pirin family protein [Alphaproteobacteria bacterium]|nr:pirin family protein [Alphaproteobacteria bacterium]